jgi:hypothetical protein
MSAPLFDHEKLRVYQHAIKFSSWLEDILSQLPKAISLHDQLERASTSIS